MAGDWIKMRGNLWDDPRVTAIVDATDSSEAAVVGALYWLWATADQHTEDGVMHGLTLRAIDRKTGVAGFGQALCSVGWLEECIDGVRIIAFEEHNGTSAKRRCTESRRKMSARDADKVQTDGGSDAEEKQQSCAPRGRVREEKNSSSLRSEEERATRSQAVACPPDVDPQVWADWLKLRKAKKAPVTETVLSGAQSEANKAGMTLEAFLRVWCRRGTQGLEAAWLRSDERAGPAETPYARQMREKYETVAPAIAAKRPGTLPAPVTFDAEVIEHENRTAARLLG